MKKENKIEVSLVVPSHNAAEVIEHALDEYYSFLSGFCSNFEIIVVANACKDNTAQIVRKISRRKNKIKLIDIEERGKGLAVLTGLKEAHYNIIGFMDADNAFYLPGVKSLIKEIGENDCIIASKWVGRNFFQISEPFTRKILAIGWRALSFALLGLNFKDTQAGCKFLRKKAFEKIDKKFICTGFDFDVELLYKLKQEGCSIKEMEVPVSKSFRFSTFRLRFVPMMFWHIFVLWIHSI